MIYLSSKPLDADSTYDDSISCGIRGGGSESPKIHVSPSLDFETWKLCERKEWVLTDGHRADIVCKADVSILYLGMVLTNIDFLPGKERSTKVVSIHDRPRPERTSVGPNVWCFWISSYQQSAKEVIYIIGLLCSTCLQQLFSVCVTFDEVNGFSGSSDDVVANQRPPRWFHLQPEPRLSSGFSDEMRCVTKHSIPSWKIDSSNISDNNLLQHPFTSASPHSTLPPPTV